MRFKEKGFVSDENYNNDFYNYTILILIFLLLFAAQEIAEEYEMLYMPPVDMQRDMYTGPHGLDFKKYNELYPDWHKLMDEKEFFADPHSVAHGAADRMFYRKLYLKYRNQICAIRHILNTGQGVVMEGCLNSDPIYMNAAVNAGFLQGESKKYTFKIILKEKKSRN